MRRIIFAFLAPLILLTITLQAQDASDGSDIKSKRMTTHQQRVQQWNRQMEEYDRNMQIYQEQVKAYEERVKAYDEEIRAYDEEARAYEERVKAYAEETRAYEERVKAYDEETRAYEEREKAYQKRVKWEIGAETAVSLIVVIACIYVCMYTRRRMRQDEKTDRLLQEIRAHFTKETKRQ